jgi:hypothetical protein
MCLALFSAVACVDPVPLENRPCPCVSGWKCCRADYMCAPEDQICPGGATCTDVDSCEQGQICFAGICYVCDRNRYCGMDCTDCTAFFSDTACVEGRCGCRSEADCSPTRVCVDNACQTPGKPDGGTGDGGMSDGSSPDAGDGGGGDTGPYCPPPWNNKLCGYSCTDCTRQGSNWACRNGRCGCYADADCPHGQTCQGGSCTGKDGGI